MRIGHGFDAHRFGPGNHIMLSGVKVPSDFGVIAHSDGDVILHALIDALLGAAALGSIGQWFPDTAAAYQGISSLIMLDDVYQAITKQQYRIDNIDCTVIAEAPKVQPHVDAMRQVLASHLEMSVNQISIKGKTTEKMGFTGRKEGIACFCVVLLANEKEN